MYLDPSVDGYPKFKTYLQKEMPQCARVRKIYDNFLFVTGESKDWLAWALDYKQEDYPYVGVASDEGVNDVGFSMAHFFVSMFPNNDLTNVGGGKKVHLAGALFLGLLVKWTLIRGAAAYKYKGISESEANRWANAFIQLTYGVNGTPF